MSTPSPSSGRRRGSALAVIGWALVWLVGTAAIAGYSMTRHAPALERAMLDEVQEAVAPIGDSPVMVSLRDHEATLSGTVADVEERDALLAAAGGALGIRQVVDRLALRDAADAADEPTETETETETEPSIEVAALDAEPDADEAAEEMAEATAEATAVAETDVDVEPAAEATAEQGADAEPMPGPAVETTAELDGNAETTPEPAADAPTAPEAVSVARATAEPTVEPTAAEAIAETLTQAVEPIADRDGAAGEGEGEGENEVTSVVDVASDADELPDENDVPDEMEVGTFEPSDDEQLAELPPEVLPGDEEDIDADDARSLPSLRLVVVDGVLNIDGVMSDDDDPATLVDRAMDSLDLDYASDALELDAAVMPADWLEPLVSLLPAFRTIDEPGIEISERRITLSGIAPDAATRERLVELAVERLGDYALVERLTIAEGQPTTPANASDENAPIADPDPTDTKDTKDPTVAQAASPAAALRAEFAALPDGEILFQSGSARLTPVGRARVDRIARVLANHPDVPLAIEGHTDGRGFRATNLRLSQRRANAVRDRLMQRGIPRERLTTYGYGEGVPVADDATAEGRAANRRIEFTY